MFPSRQIALLVFQNSGALFFVSVIGFLALGPVALSMAMFADALSIDIQGLGEAGIEAFQNFAEQAIGTRVGCIAVHCIRGTLFSELFASKGASLIIDNNEELALGSFREVRQIFYREVIGDNQHFMDGIWI